MNELIQKIRNDPEIRELKEKCHELTGRWIPYHWDCFKDLDDYKEHMRKIIEVSSSKGLSVVGIFISIL